MAKGIVVLAHPLGPEYWWLRYRFGGKEKMLMLGKYPEVSLADTQARRDEARKLLVNSVAPSENKQAAKVEQKQEAITFEEVAREWYASNKRWSEDHRSRVLRYLELYIFPHIGSSDTRQFKTSHLLAPIRKVDATGKHGVAQRLQQRGITPLYPQAGSLSFLLVLLHIVAVQ